MKATALVSFCFASAAVAAPASLFQVFKQPANVTASASGNPVEPQRICETNQRLSEVTYAACDRAFLDIKHSRNRYNVYEWDNLDVPLTWAAPGCHVRLSLRQNAPASSTDSFSLNDVITQTNSLLHYCENIVPRFRGGQTTIGSERLFEVKVSADNLNAFGGDGLTFGSSGTSLIPTLPSNVATAK